MMATMFEIEIFGDNVTIWTLPYSTVHGVLTTTLEGAKNLIVDLENALLVNAAETGKLGSVVTGTVTGK